eukprot:366226-Chlamydomonas_euryale.AAC.12
MVGKTAAGMRASMRVPAACEKLVRSCEAPGLPLLPLPDPRGAWLFRPHLGSILRKCGQRACQPLSRQCLDREAGLAAPQPPGSGACDEVHHGRLQHTPHAPQVAPMPQEGAVADLQRTQVCATSMNRVGAGRALRCVFVGKMTTGARKAGVDGEKEADGNT